MTKIVIVNDGQTTWAADQAELIAALDDLGWTKGFALGQRARFEPEADDDAAAYIALCERVTKQDMPADAGECRSLDWYPAERAWIWAA